MSRQAEFRLGTLAEIVNGRVRGDPERLISGLATLEGAGSEHLAFLANPKYRKHLKSTGAAAVLVTEDSAEHCPVDALIVSDPYLAFARLSHTFDRRLAVAEGVHPSVVQGAEVRLGKGLRLGANVVIGDGVEIDDAVEIGPGSVIGPGCKIGEGTRLAANVTLYEGVQVGSRCIIHSGAVIGSDGFGFAPTNPGWQKIVQLGSVRIGNEVEVGANTTIDRGALDDTVIEDGVILDNLVQIGHNCRIGANTAFAGCAGVSGSTKIGANCIVGGAVGIAGHLTIAEGVILTGMTMVTKSLNEPGVYSSGIPVSPQQEWRRNAVRFGQLDQLSKRVAELEKLLSEKKQS